MKTSHDIQGWFHDTSRDKLQELIEEYDVKTVIEIGTFVGKSAVFFAQNPNIEHVICIDPFVMWDEGRENGDAQRFGEDFFDEFSKNLRDAEIGHKVTVIRATATDAREKLMFNTRADLIYIDASHDYASVAEDIASYLPLADAIICGDDYDDNWPGVKQAVDEAFGDKVQVAGNLWYVTLKKV